MGHWHDKTKMAIKDGSIFDGLCVPDKAKTAALFMLPQFHLVVFEAMGRILGHIVYEIDRGTFHFHLVNFTRLRTRHTTEIVMSDFVLPLCRRQGLDFIQARVERPGMARKLQRLGFEKFSGNTYRRAVNVL